VSRIGESTITADRQDFGDNPSEFAWTKPASTDAVAALLVADPDLKDGFTRSEWLWIRLATGDLILGVFPQDEGYFMFEKEYA
jgi:hypothetical protein